ncbi:addiction module protein [Methylobacter tundripaludum]|uniref:addiction module protein n=1 Tax=Methylobacter tundripaludum TaxID=173365 RepID=UPI0002FF00E8|nr:addiction module protein [Methylobacter tundripaludum]
MIIKKAGEGLKAKDARLFTLNLSPALKSFADLDTPNPGIDAIWREEAQERWQAYKAGELKTVSYEAVMQKYL